VVITAAPVNTQSVNLKACHFSYSSYVTFTVASRKSTGRFAGASGPGAVQVSLAGYGPKYGPGPRKGRCDTGPGAPELAKGAVASVVLSAVLRS
jgi:hypothetical protein